MSPEQKAALVAAQTALFQCEMQAMIAENQHRLAVGESIAYGEEAFNELRKTYEPMLCWNAVLTLYQE